MKFSFEMVPLQGKNSFVGVNDDRRASFITEVLADWYPQVCMCVCVVSYPPVMFDSPFS